MRDVFSEGMVFVVKESEVRVDATTGKAFVRVDSPTDWVRVGGRHLDAAFVKGMVFEEPAAVELKARGNERFKEGKFGEAFLAYSRAIAAINLNRLEEMQEPPQVETMQDVLRGVFPVPDDFDPAIHAAALKVKDNADLFYALLVNRAAVAARWRTSLQHWWCGQGTLGLGCGEHMF